VVVSTVRGFLLLPGNAPTAARVPAVVRVRDITFSDAPAEAPVQQIEMLVDIAPGARRPFSIDLDDEWLAKVGRNECELNLEVHIDRDANGIFSPGDLVSMQAHPLGPTAADTEQEVSLVLV
jgi:hypothetical protein